MSDLRQIEKARLWPWFLVLAAIVGFCWRLSPLRHFILDDAFITYRFAENIAAGYGVAWNPGDPPVEGYINFLWMILNTLGIWCGIAPVVFSKTLAALSVVAMIVLFCRAARGVHWAPASIFVGALA